MQCSHTLLLLRGISPRVLLISITALVIFMFRAFPANAYSQSFNCFIPPKGYDECYYTVFLGSRDASGVKNFHLRRGEKTHIDVPRGSFVCVAGNGPPKIATCHRIGPLFN